MGYFILIVVIAIVIIQFRVFGMNLRRMNDFSRIFTGSKTFRLSRIEGSGNDIYNNIIGSINRYLLANEEVVDYNVIKETVNRHCDAIESDVDVLTPIPLYCGLAGTMIGVVCGLGSLLYSQSLSFLMDGNGIGNAAIGINDLLKGVALAMFASITGIILTTISSFVFKKRKSKEETDKNNFLSWIESEVIPALPTDISKELNVLGSKLKDFNEEFAKNSSQFDKMLGTLNNTCDTNVEMINAIHDMNFMQMAKANVSVLKELQNSTDKIEQFNHYLDSIKGYTETIQLFNEQFNKEANKVHIFEEIRDYFSAAKSILDNQNAQLAKGIVLLDSSLQNSLKQLDETTASQISEFKAHLVAQSEQMHTMLEEQKEAFFNISKQIQSEFETQLKQTPRVVQELAEIPKHLRILCEEIKKSNENLSNTVIKELSNMGESQIVYNEPPKREPLFPRWMNWAIVIILFVIAAACVTNTIRGFF